MALIELEEVSRLYGSGEQTVAAVDRFTTRIETGEFTVLAGPSGSGKTTLLNLIGCLDKPTSGRLLVAGRDVAKTPRPSWPISGCATSASSSSPTI